MRAAWEEANLGLTTRAGSPDIERLVGVVQEQGACMRRLESVLSVVLEQNKELVASVRKLEVQAHSNISCMGGDTRD